MSRTENQPGSFLRKPYSRRQFLKGAGGTAAGLLAVMAMGGNSIAGGRAFAMSALAGTSDLDILNFALTLEHLEATFYKRVVGGKYASLIGNALSVATAVKDHEVAHEDTLTKAIKAAGGNPYRLSPTTTSVPLETRVARQVSSRSLRRLRAWGLARTPALRA